MSRAVAISCEDVAKVFALVDGGAAWKLAFGRSDSISRFRALDGISFEVPKGQFVGILGRNGAGKSTLLRVLGGVYSADSGSISVNGALSGLYELGLVGNPQLTGRQYAERLLTVHGFSTRERAAMIADVLDFSELGDRFEDPVLTYSAGMSARLFFATATAGRYDVYLLDEILSVGDQHFQAKCWRRLRDRVSRGASGVLVTHDWSAIVKLCQTAHVLERGRFSFSGPADRAARRYLFGESGVDIPPKDVARFLSLPNETLGVQGQDLSLKLGVECLTSEEIFVTVAVERMQPGFGWETSLMTRQKAPVSSKPGRYAIDVKIPRLPLEPGRYEISVSLVRRDREIGGLAVKVIDSRTWLNGDGIRLDVGGPPDRGLLLPTRWGLAS